MTAAAALYHLARADFLERARRPGFLVMLGLVSGLGYLAHTGHLVLRIGDKRGELNSAWVGAMMTLVVTGFMSLIGFYLVGNAVARDRRTRVGQILASTPVSSSLYLIGKLLSNFAVLAALTLVLAGFAVALQLGGGEERRLDLWAMAAPFVVVALPAMLLTAAMAVLFESVRPLSGDLGAVLYPFVWTGMLMLSVAPGNHWLDWTGALALTDSMKTAAGVRGTPSEPGFSLRIGPVEEIATFRWEGLDWTVDVLAVHLVWCAAAVGIVLAAGMVFDRFDTVPRLKSRGPAPPAEEGSRATPLAFSPGRLSPLPADTLGDSTGPLVGAELRLILREARWWWFLGALSLVAASLLAPMEAVRAGVVPALWIWPVALWSSLGAREARDGTEALVFSSPHPVTRPLLAAWLAGVLLAVFASSGFAGRLVMEGQWVRLGQCLTAALVVPALALALGVWSRSARLFFVLYTLLWYLGPLEKAPGLDFTGASDAVGLRHTEVWLGLTALLGATAWLGRWRAVRG